MSTMPAMGFTSRFSRPRSTGERHLTRALWIGGDVALIASAALTASLVAEIDLAPGPWSIVALMAAVQVAASWRLGLYRSMVRYAGMDVLGTVTLSVALGVVAAVVATYFLRLPNAGGLGRVFLVVHAFAATALCGGIRLIVRLAIERSLRAEAKPVLIYGAGSLGELTLRDFASHGCRVVGFLDDDASRHGSLIRGHPVLGGLDALAAAHGRFQPEMLVIALRSIPAPQLRRVFEACMDLGMQVKQVQGIGTSGSRSLQLHDLALEDLLRRPPRSLDPVPVRRMLAGRSVLVTGAGGSIGSELCRQIAACAPGMLVVLDHSEFNLYQIDNDLRARFPGVDVVPVLATLADRDALRTIVLNHAPDIVFHAAAYKHVPMVEANPFLGMANNLGGFANLLEVCISHGVGQVVAISTDKAVRPTNVMGASKRSCEVLMQSIAAGGTRLCAVRFGNVLGSSGSVVPHFLEQIRRGGPVTVTHADVSRYFMLLPEAVELVLQAGAMANHGEIFILDMGEPVKIANLARQLIFMTGHVPDQDIAIRFSGLRPGEKLSEELLLDESEQATRVDGILVAKPTRRDGGEVVAVVDDLLDACRTRDLARFVAQTRLLVPEWTPSGDFLAMADGETDLFRKSGAVRTLPPER